MFQSYLAILLGEREIWAAENQAAEIVGEMEHEHQILSHHKERDCSPETFEN